MPNTISMENIVVLIFLSLLTVPSWISASQFSGGVFRKTAEAKLFNDTIIIRAPETVIGGRDDVVISRGNRQNPGAEGAGFRCHSYDLRPILTDTELQITEIKPVVTSSQFPDEWGSIVHHMDIFACQPKIEFQIPENIQERNYWCSRNGFMTMNKQGAGCSQMIWVHDKEALKYKFPPGTGIRLGNNTGYTHFLLQIHYLLPKGYRVGREDGFLDSSGFEISTGSPGTLDSHLFAFIDPKMVISPGQKNYHFSVHLSSSDLARIVGPDLKQFGKIKPFAVHLHAHNYAKALWLDHIRNGKKIDEYGSLNPFHGYGPDQSFFDLPKNATSIRPGDSLTFNCVYDTTSVRNRMIRFGVGHGDEMCGPIILYTPHGKDYSTPNLAESSCPGYGRCKNNPRRLG